MENENTGHIISALVAQVKSRGEEIQRLKALGILLSAEIQQLKNEQEWHRNQQQLPQTAPPSKEVI